MKIITVAVPKGGVGKTTIATTLAGGLARIGYRVLIVDTDPQNHVSAMLGVPNENHLFWNLFPETDDDGNVITEPPAASPTGRTGLHIWTGGNRNSWVSQMAPARLPLSALREKILGAGPYDFAVIDTPPTASWNVDAAIYAADTIIAPIQLAGLGFDSGERFAAYVQMSRTTHNLAPAEIVYLPTFAEETKVTATTLAALSEAHNGSVMSPISRAAVIEKVARSQGTIYEYAPESSYDARILGRAIQEFDALLARIDR